MHYYFLYCSTSCENFVIELKPFRHLTISSIVLSVRNQHFDNSFSTLFFSSPYELWQNAYESVFPSQVGLNSSLNCLCCPNHLKVLDIVLDEYILDYRNAFVSLRVYSGIKEMSCIAIRVEISEWDAFGCQNLAFSALNPHRTPNTVSDGS